MASSAESVAMALIVVAAVVSSGLPAAHAATNFVSRTCRRTEDAALCVAVLSADPRSARADTVHGLAAIALDIAVDTALANGGVFNRLYFRYMWTPEGDAAKVCNTAYLAATKKLVITARDSFDDRRYARASELVASAQGAGGRCDDAFKEVDGGSTVTDMNREMTGRCAVARGLIDLLASSCCCCACCSKKSF